MNESLNRDQIAALRLATEMTGQLTPVQAKTISIWPKIAIKGLKKHETRINLDTREVEYLLKLKSKTAIVDPQAIKIIEESIWALAGDTWRVIFKNGQRLLYNGVRRKEIRNDQGNSWTEDLSGFDPSGTGSLSTIRRGK